MVLSSALCVVALQRTLHLPIEWLPSDGMPSLCGAHIKLKHVKLTCGVHFQSYISDRWFLMREPSSRHFFPHSPNSQYHYTQKESGNRQGFHAESSPGVRVFQNIQGRGLKKPLAIILIFISHCVPQTLAWGYFNFLVKTLRGAQLQSWKARACYLFHQIMWT